MIRPRCRSLGGFFGRSSYSRQALVTGRKFAGASYFATNLRISPGRTGFCKSLPRWHAAFTGSIRSRGWQLGVYGKKVNAPAMTWSCSAESCPPTTRTNCSILRAFSRIPAVPGPLPLLLHAGPTLKGDLLPCSIRPRITLALRRESGCSPFCLLCASCFHSLPCVCPHRTCRENPLELSMIQAVRQSPTRR